MLKFDPFNVSLTLSSLDTTCIVFLHAESMSLVDRLPNLMRLKRDVRVMFRQFSSHDDVVQRNVKCFFPRAGAVILHHDALRRCSAGWRTDNYNRSSLILSLTHAPCGLRGCKNRPAPFPGRMSYKATKPGSVCPLSLSLDFLVFLLCC